VEKEPSPKVHFILVNEVAGVLWFTKNALLGFAGSN